MMALAKFLFIPLFGLLLSCENKNKAPNENQTNENGSASDQILLYGNGSEPRELDPSLAVGEPEGNILDNLFEGLATLHPQTLEAQPGMAESWTVSPDGKTYTFKIRKDAKWSDGKELTAEDFVWSWTRTLQPITASEYAYQLYYIKNGEAFNTGKIKDPKQLGVKALDKYTLEVELVNPTPFFIKLTAFRTLFPIPRHVIEKFPGHEWTRDKNMVSNGPYKIMEWKLNKDIKVVQNEYYWDKNSVRLKGIVFYPTENSDTEEKMFLSGKLHVTNTVPSMKIPYYEKESKKLGDQSIYSATPEMATYFYWINVKKKPMDDKRVRRALALTIDRTEIVRDILHAGQIPTGSFTPPVNGYTHEGTLPLTVTPAAIAEAKKLLTEAGYPDGKGLPKIEIHYNTLEAHKKIAVAIQSMWKKNLGIDVGLFNQEWKVYLDTQRKFEFQVSRGGWVADYPDPNTFLDLFVTNGGNNHTQWSNPAYDKLIREAAQTVEEKKRFEFFHKAESILLDELPMIPIYFYTRTRLITPKFRYVDNGKFVRWVPNVTNHNVFKNFAFVP